MNDFLVKKLDALVKEQAELEKQLSDPAVIAKRDDFARISRSHNEISAVVEMYNLYQQKEKNLQESKLMLEDTDPEIVAMAEMDIEVLTAELPVMENKIQIAVLPKDPNDEKNIVVEIRAGAGGNEASLFAGDLFRMYTKYAEFQGWKVELVDVHPGELGGYKEVIFNLEGQRVYSRMKYEQGVHRVQRVPVTEASGRIHTSTASVAVLPEAEEVDIQIDPKDLRVDVCAASGPGGQGVNTTNSAVQILHIPTGMIVRCQDERSQIKNKATAMKVLRSRLFELKRQEAEKELTEARRSQIGSADRSEKIRTYNFKENRLTDHRINMSWYKLELILEGNLGEVIDALTDNDTQSLLKQMGLENNNQ